MLLNFVRYQAKDVDSHGTCWVQVHPVKEKIVATNGFISWDSKETIHTMKNTSLTGFRIESLESHIT
jgi:hypothetical protein